MSANLENPSPEEIQAQMIQNLINQKAPGILAPLVNEALTIIVPILQQANQKSSEIQSSLDYLKLYQLVKLTMNAALRKVLESHYQEIVIAFTNAGVILSVPQTVNIFENLVQAALNTLNAQAAQETQATQNAQYAQTPQNTQNVESQESAGYAEDAETEEQEQNAQYSQYGQNAQNAQYSQSAQYNQNDQSFQNHQSTGNAQSFGNAQFSLFTQNAKYSQNAGFDQSTQFMQSVETKTETKHHNDGDKLKPSPMSLSQNQNLSTDQTQSDQLQSSFSNKDFSNISGGRPFGYFDAMLRTKNYGYKSMTHYKNPIFSSSDSTSQSTDQSTFKSSSSSQTLCNEFATLQFTNNTATNAGTDDHKKGQRNPNAPLFHRPDNTGKHKTHRRKK